MRDLQRQEFLRWQNDIFFLSIILRMLWMRFKKTSNDLKQTGDVVK